MVICSHAILLPLYLSCSCSLLHRGSSEHSPESGISTSHLSIPDADYADADVPDGDAEFEDVLPVLGKARALYPFERKLQPSNCNSCD